ncbi:mannosyl-oligosaccharide alpha-1,2-mannosidase [Coemansia sp. RSA 1813]|nr:mannosyl-oligosaccharide alpha-1,2-mannosidase [Coemansia sp. RSA 1843]KAJ2211575.1 mannosyl-oligosaccharide alpha-1,2-mannosidase [Coemansia sp. RSA 487]KAJ2565127.1 mannosyl-oligosaccharide alpha-1,2-mannosidase [Coemansia sp. RSA 1813]
MVYFYLRKFSRNSALRYGLCLGALVLTVHVFRTTIPWICSTKPAGDNLNQRAAWLDQAKAIPTGEYNALLSARFERPSIWPNYTLPGWHATYNQQRKLNDVIREALANGKEGLSSANGKQAMQERRERIVAVTKSVWGAYRRDAFGYDEYHPVSHSGTNHTRQGVGYFVADVLDTLWLMGLKEEYAEGRDFLVRHITYDQPGSVSLFETTIRVLGGLLAAFHWSGETDTDLLRLADELGTHLSRSFNTVSGIPPEIAFLQQQQEGHIYAYESSTAEVTTLQLEFRYLAKLTGNHKYREYVDKIMNITFEAPKWDSLVPIYINAVTKRFTGDIIRLGSRGDSYYEYLLKQWLQTRQTESRFRTEYDAAMEGVKKYLAAVSPGQKMTFIGELLSPRSTSPVFSPKMDHLVCFLGGNLALGATQGRSLAEMSPRELTARDREDLVLARQLTETCAHMYFDTVSGLAPEIAYFRWIDPATGIERTFDASTQLVKPHGDILVPALDRHSLLRPETVESLLILWRITGETKWRDYGWRIFQAFEQWARLPHSDDGFANLRDVTVVPPQHDDKMETFFVSETLKYLFLLFSDSDTVPLSRYVFTTEAHPLPHFTWDHI